MLLWMFLPRDAWESQQGCSSPSLSGEGWGWGRLGRLGRPGMGTHADRPAQSPEVKNQPQQGCAAVSSVAFLPRICGSLPRDAASPSLLGAPLQVRCPQRSLSLTQGSSFSRCPKQQQT